jgi:hypothetical protein
MEIKNGWGAGIRTWGGVGHRGYEMRGSLPAKGRDGIPALEASKDGDWLPWAETRLDPLFEGAGV